MAGRVLVTVLGAAAGRDREGCGGSTGVHSPNAPRRGVIATRRLWCRRQVGVVDEIDVIAGVTLAGRVVDGRLRHEQRRPSRLDNGAGEAAVSLRWPVLGAVRRRRPRRWTYYSIVDHRTIAVETQRGRAVRVSRIRRRTSVEIGSPPASPPSPHGRRT